MPNDIIPIISDYLAELTDNPPPTFPVTSTSLNH